METSGQVDRPGPDRDSSQLDSRSEPAAGRAHVLVVEDDPSIRARVCEYLEISGHQVSAADTCAAAREVFRTAAVDVALVDYSLPDGNALNLLKVFKTLDREVPIIVLTAHGSIDLAVRAIKEGAEQFLTKPIDLPSLLVVVEKALEHRRNRRQLAGDQVVQSRQTFSPFFGRSRAVLELEEQALRVVTSHVPILILGETGAGKGVLARWLHHNGPRAREPYVELNCAGLTRDLMESELFGHERGAFTGATAAKIGLIEVAHRGTMFLDEVGDMDIAVQPKLLKVLEDKRFRRVGDVRERTVDVRFVAAANQDLLQKAQDKTFRQDLLYRINTVTLHVAPLRERRDDIPLLAATILTALARDIPPTERTLTSGAIQALQDYPWPGNLRELRNVLEHAVLLTSAATIDADALGLRRAVSSLPPPAAAAAAGGDHTLKALEIQEIVRALQTEGGHVGRAARRLGVPRSSLYQKIRKFGIPQPKSSTAATRRGAGPGTRARAGRPLRGRIRNTPEANAGRSTSAAAQSSAAGRCSARSGSMANATRVPRSAPPQRATIRRPRVRCSVRAAGSRKSTTGTAASRHHVRPTTCGALPGTGSGGVGATTAATWRPLSA